jgi:two-component sensor histidine kinase
VQTPSRRGFGSRLIERGIAGEFGGRVEMDYRPEGFCCTARLPLSEKAYL